MLLLVTMEDIVTQTWHDNTTMRNINTIHQLLLLCGGEGDGEDEVLVEWNDNHHEWAFAPEKFSTGILGLTESGLTEGFHNFKSLAGPSRTLTGQELSWVKGFKWPAGSSLIDSVIHFFFEKQSYNNNLKLKNIVTMSWGSSCALLWDRRGSITLTLIAASMDGDSWLRWGEGWMCLLLIVCHYWCSDTCYHNQIQTSHPHIWHKYWQLYTEITWIWNHCHKEIQILQPSN